MHGNGDWSSVSGAKLEITLHLTTSCSSEQIKPEGIIYCNLNRILVEFADLRQTSCGITSSSRHSRLRDPHLWAGQTFRLKFFAEQMHTYKLTLCRNSLLGVTLR